MSKCCFHSLAQPGLSASVRMREWFSPVFEFATRQSPRSLHLTFNTQNIFIPFQRILSSFAPLNARQQQAQRGRERESKKSFERKKIIAVVKGIRVALRFSFHFSSKWIIHILDFARGGCWGARPGRGKTQAKKKSLYPSWTTSMISTILELKESKWRNRWKNVGSIIEERHKRQGEAKHEEEKKNGKNFIF